MASRASCTSLSDASGDSAIFHAPGQAADHHDRSYQVMTNSPTFDNNWPSTTTGRLAVSPCCPAPTARRTVLPAPFYIKTPLKTDQANEAVAGVMA